MLDYKKDLTVIYKDIVAFDMEDEDPLIVAHSKLKKLLFDCSYKIKKLLGSLPTVTPVVDSKGVRLPKLDVPTFDGNILNWTQFWEQFSVSVHDRPVLSDSEKLVYLQHALKDGSAKKAIEGLSHSGDNYREVVESLKSRYDRPPNTPYSCQNDDDCSSAKGRQWQGVEATARYCPATLACPEGDGL